MPSRKQTTQKKLTGIKEIMLATVDFIKITNWGWKEYISNYYLGGMPTHIILDVRVW